MIPFCSVDQINCSLFALHIETYQWILKFTTCSEHVLRTLRKHLDLNTTRKQPLQILSSTFHAPKI